MDYKKYSLENLEKWMTDALLSSEATPQEIYDIIRKVVEEEYHYFKHHTGRCYDLLALLNGNGNSIFESVKAHGELWDKEDIDAILKEREYYEGVSYEDKVLSCDKDDNSPECQKAWNDFWEDSGSTKESSQYTEEELNAMCDAAEDKEKCREYNLREAEYYNKRAELDAKQDKVVKWQLPVEVDGLTGECIVEFPDDLLEAANLKEGDTVEWIDRKDGSFELRKVKNAK